MCKTLYIDCESGVSGDMFLGAMVDLGVPSEYLTERLSRLDLPGYALSFGTKSIGGVNASDVDVILDLPEDQSPNPYSGNYRNYRQIREMIAESTLSDQEKDLADRIFDIKANAESVVHGVPVDEVKFHEAGAVDSVVDIVGAAVCLSYFSPDRVVSRRVPTGYGHIKCACGILPVPAPAVRQIIEDTGLPSYRSDIPQEVLTPTGASIMAGIVDEFSDDPAAGECIGQGFGTGKRDTGLPPLKVTLNIN